MSKLSASWFRAPENLTVLAGGFALAASAYAGAAYERYAVLPWLPRFTYLTLALCAVIIAAASFWLVPALLSRFKQYWSHQENRVMTLFLSLGTGLFILFFGSVPVRDSRLFFDEQLYMGIAQTMALTGKAYICHHCDAEYDVMMTMIGGLNKQPNGFPFLMSVFFQLFGVSEPIAFSANTFAWVVGIFSVTWLAHLLFQNARLAFLAGAMFGVTPVVLRWAGSASSEVSSASWCALSAAAVLFMCHRPTYAAAFFAAATVGWAAHIRYEILLHIAFLLAYVGISQRKQIMSPPFLVFGGVVALLLASLLLQLYEMHTDSWGSPDGKFTITAFWQNLRTNAPFLVSNNRYPVLFTVLGAIGALWHADRFARAFLLFWFAWSWGLYLFFYAGGYELGVGERYSILFAPPLALLAARGLDRLSRFLSERCRIKSAFSIATALLAIHVLPFVPLARSVEREGLQARLDVAAIRTFAPKLPPNSLVVSHVPSFWNVLERNAYMLQIAAAGRLDLEHFARRYPGGIFLHWGYWCSVNHPIETRFCAEVEKRFRSEVVAEFNEGGFKYELRQIQLDTP